ncbi:MAG: DUF459 domain-containing protein [Xanthobacteraceae bacterium]
MAVGLSLGLLLPAQAQFWDWGNRPQRYQEREYNPFGGWFGSSPRWERRSYEAPREAPVDFSRAPPGPPKKAEATTPIVVVGDANADWLAYGLEDAFSEKPEISIVRKHRTESGLIRYGGRGEIEWPQVIREIIGADKPKFLVMMIGNNDRQAIREKVPPVVRPAQKGAAQATPAAPAPGTAAASAPPPTDPEQQPTEAPAAVEPPPANLTPEQARQAAYGPWEFHSEKWELAYIRRIDAAIAALKSAGVPVIWVGLPSQRVPKASSDSSYLNELYRSRAEKAGITYVDIWDGFVDEGGRFALQGPDYEGQIRRLRTNDGVYFTKFGARKLAHYVEREIQRYLSNHGLPVALPMPEDMGPQGKSNGPAQRPSVGPVVPLTSAKVVPEELIGGGRPAPKAGSGDAAATRVLTKGEPLPATSGRADDFSWPRGSNSNANSEAAPATVPIEPVSAPSPAPAATPQPGTPGKPAATKGAPAAQGAQQAPGAPAPAAPEQARQPQRRARSDAPRSPLSLFQGLFR